MFKFNREKKPKEKHDAKIKKLIIRLAGEDNTRFLSKTRSDKEKITCVWKSNFMCTEADSVHVRQSKNVLNVNLAKKVLLRPNRYAEFSDQILPRKNHVFSLSELYPTELITRISRDDLKWIKRAKLFPVESIAQLLEQRSGKPKMRVRTPVWSTFLVDFSSVG